MQRERQALLQLTERLTAAVDEWQRSPAYRDMLQELPETSVKRIADVIEERLINPPVHTEAIQEHFPQLPSILDGASANAAPLYEFIKSLRTSNAQVYLGLSRKELTMLERKAVVLRDSLKQAAQLIRGEDLGEPAEREFNLTHDSVAGGIDAAIGSTKVDKGMDFTEDDEDDCGD